MKPARPFTKSSTDCYPTISASNCAHPPCGWCSRKSSQIITATEGGALAVQTAADDGMARMQRWYGIDRKGRQPNVLGYYDFDVNTVGYGYYLTNLAAAIGVENLKTLDEQQTRRHTIADYYLNELTDIPGLTLLRRFSDRCPSHHFFTVLVDRRAEFCRKLQELGVGASIVHARNDDYTVFGGRRDDLPNLDNFSEKYVGLPIHMHLTDEDLDAVIKSVRAGW